MKLSPGGSPLQKDQYLVSRQKREAEARQAMLLRLAGTGDGWLARLFQRLRRRPPTP